MLAGSFAAAPAAAAVTDAIDGATNSPPALASIAVASLFCVAYASSAYPMAPGVCFTCPATPSLPFAPSPAGHCTSFPFPGLAAQAGEALENIYTQVGKISERNLLIASASEEQAAVAREVDRNIVNISDFSTQSAAGANQTSASAQELARLAVDLNGLVTRFVI